MRLVFFEDCGGWNIQKHSLFTFPELDGVKHDLAIRASLESKSGSEFVLCVNDRDCLVFVAFTVTIDANNYLTRLVLDDQVDPLTELHA